MRFASQAIKRLALPEKTGANLIVENMTRPGQVSHNKPMLLPEVIKTLRTLNHPVPRPARLPTETEIAGAELRLGVRFPPDYRYFLLYGSDVVYGILEPARVTPDAGHSDLIDIATRAWEGGISREFLPFCGDNGDYYCFAPDGRIGLLSHDGLRDGTWPDLAHWIQEVWIDEFQKMQDESPST